MPFDQQEFEVATPPVVDDAAPTTTSAFATVVVTPETVTVVLLVALALLVVCANGLMVVAPAPVTSAPRMVWIRPTQWSPGSAAVAADSAPPCARRQNTWHRAAVVAAATPCPVPATATAHPEGVAIGWFAVATNRSPMSLA